MGVWHGGTIDQADRLGCCVPWDPDFLHASTAIHVGVGGEEGVEVDAFGGEDALTGDDVEDVTDGDGPRLAVGLAEGEECVESQFSWSLDRLRATGRSDIRITRAVYTLGDCLYDAGRGEQCHGSGRAWMG